MSRGFRSVRGESFGSPSSPGMSPAVATPAPTSTSPRSSPRGHHQRQVSHSVMLRLKILDGLRLNQRVHVKDYGDGRVKFLGCVHFAQGLFVGIELETSLGKHDGSFRGKRYFTAKPKHGIFVRKSRVQIIDNPPPSTRATRNSRLSATSFSARNLRLPTTSGHMTQNFFVPMRANASLSVTLPKKVMEPQGVQAKLEFVIEMCKKELESVSESSLGPVGTIPENRSVRTAESLPIVSEINETPPADDSAPKKRRFLSWTEVPSLKNIGAHLGLTPRQKDNEQTPPATASGSASPNTNAISEEQNAEQLRIIDELKQIILEHEESIRELEQENGDLTAQIEAVQAKLEKGDSEIDAYQQMYLDLQDEVDKVRSEYDERLREYEAENLKLYKELTEQQQIIDQNAGFAETQKHTKFKVTELERKIHNLHYALLYGDSQKDQVISDCYKQLSQINSSQSRRDQEMKNLAMSMRNAQHIAIEEWIFDVGDHVLGMNSLDAY